MEPVVINYQYTDNLYRARLWLDSLPDLIACDFEAASMYTAKMKALFQLRLNMCKDRMEAVKLRQKIKSDGLSHPSLSVITHFSVAWSDRDSYVIICNSDRIRHFIFQFIVSTERMQLWHYGLYDFKHVMYHTGLLPKRYIDTQLLAKCLLNDAYSARDRVGLKELMAYKYGEWALSDEDSDYTLENMWNPKMIQYTATDSPATYGLYVDIQKELGKWTI